MTTEGMNFLQGMLAGLPAGWLLCRLFQGFFSWLARYITAGLKRPARRRLLNARRRQFKRISQQMKHLA